MRILFLHSNIPNYVADGLFHGLRSISEHEVADVPRHDVMYQDATPEMLAKTGSRGRTLYALLPPESDKIRSARVFWQRELDQYDLIIMADIAQMPAVFKDIFYLIGEKSARKKLVVVDGYDYPARFPYLNTKHNLQHQKWVYRLPLHKVMYFKREFESTKSLYGPFSLLRPFKQMPALHFPISMSIPASCIQMIPEQEKNLLFVQYNVDPDLKELFTDGHFADIRKVAFQFHTDEAYNRHLESAKFGITTRRVGWDCLRHYEYAAKGVVLCFKRLNHKPDACAPFQLNTTNCIMYHDKADLMKQINALTPDNFKQLQTNTFEWIKQYTTVEVARRFLNTILQFRE